MGLWFQLFLALFLIPFIAAGLTLGLIMPRMGLLKFNDRPIFFISAFTLVHSALSSTVLPTAIAAAFTAGVFVALGGGNAYGFIGTLIFLAVALWYLGTVVQLGFLLSLFRHSVERKSRKSIWIGALVLVVLEVAIAIPTGFVYQMVMQENIRWGVIDKTGNFVVQPNAESGTHHSLSQDYSSNNKGVNGDPQLYEYHDGGQFGVAHSINHNGKQMLPYSEGLALAKDSGDAGWGYINNKEKFVISRDSFDDARSFKDGVAAVALHLRDSGERCSSSSSGGRDWWGYIDHSGKWVIRPQFARAESFSEGLACVGVRVANQEQYSDVIRYGYIDKTGKFVIPPVFNYAYSFWNGKADVGVNTNNHFFAKQAPKTVSPPKIPDGPVRSELVSSMVDWARRCVTSWRTGEGAGNLIGLDDCNEWLEKKPDDAEIIAVRAIVRCNEYPIKMAEAEKDARLAISYNANCALAHGVLGHLLDIKQKYQESVSEFSKAIAAEPQVADWYAFRGLAYEGLDDYTNAIADYTKMITLEPNSQWGLGERAHAYLSGNDNKPSATDIEAALKDIEAILKVNPNNVYALKQRADAYYKSGKFAQGVTDLERAESLLDPHSPELVEILNMQGYFYEKVGNKAKSKAAWKRCDAITKEINGK